MALYFLLFIVLAKATFGNVGEVTFVSELSSKPVQKLSKYSWYGNARLQRFHIPEETAIARWFFTVTKGHSFHCTERNATIHIRHGAPPVINPRGTTFPDMTMWNPSRTLILPVTSLSSAAFSLFNPAPGHWFVATHLPEDDGRIEQKGFPSCSYFFQSQLSIRRAVDTPIMQTGIKLRQTAAPNKPARLKLYVPQFSWYVLVTVDECSSAEGAGSTACSVALSLGSGTLLNDPVRLNCSGASCTANLTNPPWDTWLRVVVESVQENQTVTFNIVSNYAERCKPESEGLGLHSNSSSSAASNSSMAIETLAFNSQSKWLNLSPSACVWRIPVLYEETDVLWLGFTPVNGPNVSVSSTHPTLLTYPLPAHVTGGTLNLQLTLNTTNVTPGNNSTVVACFTPQAPILQLGKALQCHTGLFPGYGLNVSTSFPKAVIRLPFPPSVTWYLTLQLMCNSDCGNVSVVSVDPEVFVSTCVEDCGPFGHCQLLRSYNYLYGACVCKAGWRGWGCTDNSTAMSFSQQLLATLLLTLSNLSFLPAIVLAIKRFYITEASVYLFTFFFSTFYHACDQPGIAVWCIMSYDTLQYCDFLGSICSFWVTILCMARVRSTVKYALFLLGTLLIAMSLQLDRRGLWNLLGPILVAIVVMVAAWIYRGVTRRQCYPPSWQRWVFYLIPGLLCALIGTSLYIFAETEDNYYYTHSIWHILVAFCLLFLLPPREKSRPAVNWTRGWRTVRNCTWLWTPRICGYTLCQSSKDELQTVT
ncbi:post-GPI attachment to proteins factor 6 [Vanacampus margaritifer]